MLFISVPVSCWSFNWLQDWNKRCYRKCRNWRWWRASEVDNSWLLGSTWWMGTCWDGDSCVFEGWTSDSWTGAVLLSQHDPRWAPFDVKLTCLTFIGPCIVIYSYSKSQWDALFLKFILVKNYIFRADVLSIIRSLNSVYTAIGICHDRSVLNM